MFPITTRFLIIDDMPSLRDVLKRILNARGYKDVTEAGDGQEAYQLLLANKTTNTKFDVIICDWNMPNMSGMDLLKVVRAYDDWKTVPFIMLTTESEKMKVIQAIQAGTSNYMIKPVSDKMVVEKLEAVWKKLSEGKV